MNIKAKTQKSVSQKENLIFEEYKHCLEAIQLENEINHLQKHNLSVDNLRENHAEFMKIKKLIFKTREVFRTEEHNFFTEEVNKFTLSSNDDKRIQSMDSVEIYAYGMSKDLVCNKEEIKCNNIINNTKNN